MGGENWLIELLLRQPLHTTTANVSPLATAGKLLLSLRPPVKKKVSAISCNEAVT